MKDDGISSSENNINESASNEKLLETLLKIVDLNPNSDAVLETIKVSGIKLDKVKDLLAKQHPELKRLEREDKDFKHEVNQKTAEGNERMVMENKINDSSKKMQEKNQVGDLNEKTNSIKGKPPGPPPPLKSKSDSAKTNIMVNTGNGNVKETTIRRGAPPKAPPPLKSSLMRGKASNGICLNSSGLESNHNMVKLSELDFGPTPPLGFEPKRLHWSVIPQNKIFGTIWEDIHFSKVNDSNIYNKDDDILDANRIKAEKNSDELEFDTESILDQFFENKTALMDKLNIECTNTNNNSTKKYKVVLDSKRSQNIEIALKAMQLFDNNNELDISPIKCMLGYTKGSLEGGIDLFLKGVSKERLKILLDLYPTPDEIQLLNTISDEYNDGGLPLRSSEYFLKSVLNLNRFKTRAQCVLSMKTFEEEYLSCLERLIKLEDAVVHIRSSLEKGGVLRQILELTLKIGNYLNHGTNRGKSYGFRFHSIELLKNVKSNNSKSNLLKYISKVLYDHSDETRQNIDVIYQVCSEAAPIDIADVYRDIDELGKNIEFIQKEIKQFPIGNSEMSNKNSIDKDINNSKSADTNYLKLPKYIDFNNQLDIPVFEVDQVPDKTTNELYLEIVEKFVNKSSKQLEVVKKQLNDIINKLNKLQQYTGETQSNVAINNSSKSLPNSNIEIIKRCDMFFRLIKYEFNEFQIIEKKKRDKEIRKLMSTKSFNRSSNNVQDKLLIKPNNIGDSKNPSDYSSINELDSENILQSENIHHSNQSQLLLEISNLTITSNSSTLSSSDSSYFQDINIKNKSGNEVLNHSDNNNRMVKNFEEAHDNSNSLSLTLNSGFDPILNTIERYSNNCSSKIITVCDHVNDQVLNSNACLNTIFDQGTCFSLKPTCSAFPAKTCISNDHGDNIHCKHVNNKGNQPLHLRSFFDTNSAAANLTARVYDSQIIHSSNRTRKPQN